MEIRSFKYTDDEKANDNVIVASLSNLLKIEDTKKYKLFQIIDNIWICPERYLRDVKDINGLEDDFNKKFLSTPEEKNEFLDNITTVFKRINSCDAGKKFLKKLSAAIPFPVEKHGIYEHQWYLNNNKNGLENKKKVCNLIIFGPGTDLTENRFVKLPTENGSNGKGTIGYIAFNPKYIKAVDNIIMDPAVTMFHELLHGMYALYGMSINESGFIDNDGFVNKIIRWINEDIKVNLEEYLVFGGADTEKFKSGNKKYSKLKEKYISDYKKIHDEVSRLQESTFKDRGVLKTLQIKYPKDNSDITKYVEDILNLSEVSFITAQNGLRGATTRKHYVSSKEDTYEIKLSTDYYSIETGFLKGQDPRKYKKIQLKKPVNMTKIQIKNSPSTKANVAVSKEKLTSIIPSKYFQDMSFVEEVGDIHSLNSQKQLSSNGELLANSTHLDDSIIPKIQIFNNSDSENVVTPIENNLPPTEAKIIETAQPTTWHYLNAQDIPQNINPQETRIQLVDSFEESLKGPEKVYGYFPKVRQTLNNDFTNHTASMVGFSSWLETVVQDFSTNAEQKDTTDKIVDVTAIVPWVGQALNIGNDVRHGDFRSALIDTGVVILFEVAPELALPAMIAIKIKSDLHNLEIHQIHDKVMHFIALRFKQWEDIYNLTVYQWWENYYLQLHQKLQQVRQSLASQIQATRAIIDYQYHQSKSNFKEYEKEHLENRINSTEEKLHQSAQKALKNVAYFFRSCAIKYFNEQLLPKAKERLREVDKQTLQTALKFLDDNKDKLKDAELSQFQNTLKSNFSYEPEFQFNKFPTVQQLMEELLFSIEQHSVLNLKVQKVPTTNSSDETKDKEKIMDVSGSVADEDITTKGVSFVPGRSEQAIELKSSNSSQIMIKNNKNFQFGNHEDFTISFWLRVAKPKTSGSMFTSVYDLISNYSDQSSKKGWQIRLTHEESKWHLTFDLMGGTQLISEPIEIVPDNRWHHFTFTLHRIDKLTTYLDAKLQNSRDISTIGDLNNTDPLVIKLTSPFSGNSIKIEDLNIFSKCLSTQDVIDLYKKYFADPFVRDCWGEKVQYGKEYYLQNKQFPGGGLTYKEDFWSSLPIEKIHRWSLGYWTKLLKIEIKENHVINRLYTGEKIIIASTNDTNNKDVTYEDAVKLKLAKFTDGYFKLYNTTSRWIYLSTEERGSVCKFVPEKPGQLHDKQCFKIKVPADRKVGFIKPNDTDDFWLWSNTSYSDSDSYADIMWELIPKDEGWQDE